MSLYGIGLLGSALSVLDYVSIGSSISFRSFARMGSAFSVYGITRCGSSVSVLDYIELGSSLSIRSYTRVGIFYSFFSVVFLLFTI